MTLSIVTTWWIAAGLAVAAELATGSFYLLMIALGLAAGGLTALFGAASSVQLLVAALVACGATALLYWRRSRLPASQPARSNRDVNLDIGEPVHVVAWADDRTARVPYRGSVWSARLAPGALPAPGLYRVSAVEGNWLVLAPA
ncbi:MAG: NfeD family protein [Pseudomonadota bacterium]|nr:NfeD family protein [Pseudomonadota bacterium]